MTLLFTRSLFVYRSLLKLPARRSAVRKYGNIWFTNASFGSKYCSGKSKRDSYSYVIDDTTAKSIAEYVKQHTSNDAYVFEANPGPGILSRAMLEAGIPHLRVFEKEENFSPTLQELKSSYPDSFEIVNEDLMLLPKSETKDFHEGTEEADVFFHGIRKRMWKEASPISLVSVIANQTSVNFMRSMLPKISMMSSFFAFGRCQFFLIFSEKEYMYVTAKPKKNLDKYRSCTVLYNIFFDINFIKEVPGVCLSSDHLSLKKRVKWEASNLYFAHLIPKADMFESVAPADILPELYYFVRHHMTKRTDNVIEVMEKWIPSCGSRLVFDGMKTFTRFGDLRPSEMLYVFQLFSSWPEYEESTFKHVTELFFHQCLYDIDGLIQDQKQ